MQKLSLFLNIHLGEHLQKALFLQDKNAVLWMEGHNREKYVFKCIWIGVDVALEGLPCYDANLSIQGSLLDFCVNWNTNGLLPVYKRWLTNQEIDRRWHTGADVTH